MSHWLTSIVLASALCVGSSLCAQTNLVRNGDFSQLGANGAPEGWSSAGAENIKQELTRDVGPDGRGFSAKLTCTEFHDGTPSSHAMICQVGAVAVQLGKWYKLTLQAKGQGIAGGVRVGLSNMNPWGSAGLSGTISARSAWKPYEFAFRSTMDLPAENSRLQFWFLSTGTLWLANVALTETDMRPARHPQLVTEGRTNFIPNSSFECGGAGWGSYAPDLANYWYGNAFRLMGAIDSSAAAHGAQSLRITLDEKTPHYYFDYYEPVHREIGCLVAAHEGWLHATPGQTYTVSAAMKADQPGRVGVLFARQADGRSLRKDVPLTDQWQRYSFSFQAQSEYLWTGVGVDRTASQAPAVTVWVDAVQLEQAAEATAYQPALPVEVMAEGTCPGNAFPADAKKASIGLRLAAFNNTNQAATPAVTLAVTDFTDKEVLRREVSLKTPAQAGATTTVELPVNKLGFLRVAVLPTGQPPLQPLRCMTFRPYAAKDSRFGMNHAYPWDDMLPLAGQAGVLWWRDWTTQWNTVQPQRDAAFDFTKVDEQIDRVLQQQAKVLALFPFPSSEWASAATDAAIDKLNLKPWQRKQVITAFKPTDDAAFSKFITESVKHLGNRLEWFQFLNESLYTHYALPASAGYTLDDYLHLLRLTHDALKAARPEAKLLAGLGIWADSKWTRDFVEAGGLQYADALDMHLYPSGDAENYGESIARLWARMKERGEAKPIWVTELGCYADDDPAITPFAASFGDDAMRNALKASEQEAAEWLIKFSTLVFANGGEKIFLHAGTCGEINGDSTGGTFFKSGGTPRKLLPAVAAMATLLPPSARFERAESLGDQVTAYWFTSGSKRVAVTWSQDGELHPLRAPAQAQVLDLMGNPAANAKEVGGTPVYLVR